jgi:D-alanyl-D-alanine carboxypeptidase (penicillin-binding protein 5/6)
MRLIAVVMGEADATVRNSEVSSMLDYGYAQYELETLLTTDSVLGSTEVDKGKTRYIEVVPKEDITFLNKKLAQKTNATYKVKMYKVKAPLKVGDEIGKIEVYEDDEVIREVAITVKENVEKINIFKLYFRYLGDIISGNIEL